MIAVDTNVIIRLVTEDNPVQATKARDLFQSGPISIPLTVLLETEWVLRRLYKRDPDAIIDTLEALISLPNVRCQNEPAVRRAIAWRRSGLDFADALHLALAGDVEQLATFDHAFACQAALIGAAPPVVDLVP
jgi:predicted nucleic acid-binding protein